MNTNAIHNILNFVGLIIGAIAAYDWTLLGMSPATAATVTGIVLLADKIIKLAINIIRDGLGGLFAPQPPVSK